MSTFIERPIDMAIDNLAALATRIAESGPGLAYNKMREKLPRLPERGLVTPFGRVRTPELNLPSLAPLQPTDAQLEALKAGAAIDASFPVSWIPVVGDIVADVVEDVYAEKLQESLTPQELQRYYHWDKGGPATVAVVRAITGK